MKATASSSKTTPRTHTKSYYEKNNSKRKKSKKQNKTGKEVIILLAVVVIGLVGAYFGLTTETPVELEEATSNTQQTSINVEKTNEKHDNQQVAVYPTEEVIVGAIAEEEIKEEEEEEKYEYYSGTFELPLEGTTGWASVELNRRDQPNGNLIDTLVPGISFTILEEVGDWFKVRTADGIEGYVFSAIVLVNLPDIIPSIIYEDTNSYSSMFKSSGVELDNITGQTLYNVLNWNERLQCEQFDMPVMYGMTLKIMEAQRAARNEGYSLKIYETYRPIDTQIKVAESMKNLRATNQTVAQGLKSNIWSLGWFIATNVSNHQRGYAMDVSLVKIEGESEKTTGIYRYAVTDSYTELEMPTPIHELSAQAARYEGPNSSSFASTMNDNAKLLHKFCTEAGLSPLKSEWWHFNDETISSSSDGQYFLAPNQSIEP